MPAPKHNRNASKAGLLLPRPWQMHITFSREQTARLIQGYLADCIISPGHGNGTNSPGPATPEEVEAFASDREKMRELNDYYRRYARAGLFDRADRNIGGAVDAGAWPAPQEEGEKGRMKKMKVLITASNGIDDVWQESVEASVPRTEAEHHIYLDWLRAACQRRSSDRISIALRDPGFGEARKDYLAETVPEGWFGILVEKPAIPIFSRPEPTTLRGRCVIVPRRPDNPAVWVELEPNDETYVFAGGTFPGKGCWLDEVHQGVYYYLHKFEPYRSEKDLAGQ
jgi:hypothetical protein